MKALERMWIILIAAAVTCTLATILFSIMELEELNGVAGHITCILSVGAIAVAFTLMNAQENEKNKRTASTDKRKNPIKAADVKPEETFAEYIVYNDETQSKPTEE